MSFPSTSACPKDAGLLIPVGMKLRDEFLCPITRLLITDPVIASDGHTYDRTAIERWLKTHSNSPKTGETLKTKDLTPNITLKRLLQDLLTSKSDALFCEDVGSGDVVMQRVYLVKEDVLVLKCLGPVESQWNGKSFRTTVTGCIGGRRRPKEEKTGRDFIQFSDATVSRRHFEIKYSDSKFYISDLGSAGGTFIRVVKESSVRVKRGMMVMVGKHQLVFSRPGEEVEEGGGGGNGVGDMDVGVNGGGGEEKVKGKEGKKNTQTHPLQQFSNPSIDYDSTEEKDDTQTHTTPNNAINPTPSLETEENYLFPGPDPNLSVKCFAPEGTPIQGEIYEVGRTGATLGRKTCNTISFSQTGETGETVGLDSSISGEHASICWKNNSFYVQDGKEGKGSTNGTWLRLSAMHKPSQEYELKNGCEILIGTVRFHCFVEQQVVEKDVESEEEVEEEGGDMEEEEAEGEEDEGANDLSATLGEIGINEESKE